MSTIIGLAASFFTTISFLPQVIKAWKTKKTRDISLPMFLIMITGSALWIIYGILIKDIIISGVNSLVFILILTIIALKIKHG